MFLDDKGTLQLGRHQSSGHVIFSSDYRNKESSWWEVSRTDGLSVVVKKKQNVPRVQKEEFPSSKRSSNRLELVGEIK